jgi:hypothetical protein
MDPSSISWMDRLPHSLVWNAFYDCCYYSEMVVWWSRWYEDKDNEDVVEDDDNVLDPLSPKHFFV